MPHHAMEIFLRHLVFRLAGQHFFRIAPAVVVLVLCLIYGPIAYFMIRSALNSD
jgi:hypothetical protein